MKKKSLLVSYLLLILLAFTGCTSSDEDFVEPVSFSVLNRTFTYLGTSEVQEATYPDRQLQTTASLLGDRFRVSVTTQYPAGRDNIDFVLERNDFTPDLIGNYAIKSLPDPERGAVNLTYIYEIDNSSSSLYFSNTNIIEGTFTINSYNQRQQLISGEYTIVIRNAYDPTYKSVNLANARRCDITLTGEFQNKRIDLF